MNGTKWIGAVLAVTVVLFAAVFYWDKSTAEPSSPSQEQTPGTIASRPFAGWASSPSPSASASAAVSSSEASVSSVPVERDDAHPAAASADSGGFTSGQPATAQINVDGESYQLTPNQIGGFQRITVSPKAKIDVSLAYPQGQPGDVVGVEVEDSGSLSGGASAKAMSLDKRKTLAFQFQTTEQIGIYRITLRNGADVKSLNFWVAE